MSEAVPPAQDETELREAQRLESVGRLASGVAHDFNNLLTGIMLYCDLLIADAVKDGRSHRHADEIRKAGEHGARVVEQLLAVARPPAAAPRVALNEVVKDMEELLTRLIGENIVLTISLSRDLGAVGMNPAQVQQILLNLVLNARDAMRDGGRITIATRNCMNYLQGNFEAKKPADQFSRVEVPQNQPWVELTVYDTGCGMDNRHSESCIRALLYYQEARTRKRSRSIYGVPAGEAGGWNHRGRKPARNRYPGVAAAAKNSSGQR